MWRSLQRCSATNAASLSNVTARTSAAAAATATHARLMHCASLRGGALPARSRIASSALASATHLRPSSSSLLPSAARRFFRGVGGPSSRTVAGRSASVAQQRVAPGQRASPGLAPPSAATRRAPTAAAASAGAAASPDDAMQDLDAMEQMLDEEEGLHADMSPEEAHIFQLDDELEAARCHHFDRNQWKHGGALPAARVLDINPDDPPVTLRERTQLMAEFAADLPRTLADFGALREAGFSDEGTPLEETVLPPREEDEETPEAATKLGAKPREKAVQKPKLSPAEEQEDAVAKAEQAKDDAAYLAASAWLPAESLAAVLDLQDKHPAPRGMEITRAQEAEDRDLEAFRRGNAVRKRYAALVTHTSWLWGRASLLLDSPAGWMAPDEVRYRFVGQQLQRIYRSALQCLAYFSVHAIHMTPLGSETADAMCRQSWFVLAQCTGRMSHLQEESIIVLEHLQEWAEDDRERGGVRKDVPGVEVHREVAAVHAFCGRWSRSIQSEHMHLREHEARVLEYTQALRESTPQGPEYGLQHYASEALPSLTRISHALLQSPSEEDVEIIAQQMAEPSEEKRNALEREHLPHYTDVLGAVHAAQFAVGLVWRFASLLDHKSSHLQRHLAEAQARQAGETEIADKLALRIAEEGAQQVMKLAGQHAAWHPAHSLDPRSLLDTALMQDDRVPKELRGVANFLHFMDRVPADEAAAARHEWSFHNLATRSDAAAAHQQLAFALQAWLDQERELAARADAGDADAPTDTFSEHEFASLQRCVAGAHACAESIAALAPNVAAAQRVQQELESVDQEEVGRIVAQVKQGIDADDASTTKINKGIRSGH